MDHKVTSPYVQLMTATLSGIKDDYERDTMRRALLQGLVRLTAQGTGTGTGTPRTIVPLYD
jgi:hypothetical protein